MEDNNKCGFCHTGEDTESICGTLHKDKVEGKVVCAHHKCMQYSALLVQYKTDSFGGFMKQEVAKEIKRGGRLVCALCKMDKTKKFKKGATSGCSLASCHKSFHYLCVSMNPETIAKRYIVAVGDKVVILYRVFCCQDHETRYTEHLSADDIVGKNESSDDDKASKDDDKASKDDEETDDSTDTEPPTKKSKTAYSRLIKKSEKGESESGMSSPGMTTEEVVKETRRQYNTLLQNSTKALDTQTGDEDSFLTATSSHESNANITDDFNTSNSPGESDVSENGPNEMKNIDEGFHIIIPSKLDEVELKTICEQAGYSEESCLLWPKVYNKNGLQDKHMPYVMWNLATKLRHQDLEGFVKCLSTVTLDTYDCLYTLEKSENIEIKLKLLSEKICSSYKCDLCRVMNTDKLYILLLSLPKAMLEGSDVWSAVNVYQWSKDTIIPSYTIKQLEPSVEKKVILNWLLPRLRKNPLELKVFPQEETLRLDHGYKFLSVAREIEFQLEAIPRNLLAKSLVKVVVVREVNRDIVHFKLYIQKVMDLFFTKNMEHECYCVVHVLPSDDIHTLKDLLPACMCRDVQVFSAFSPSITPVSCLVAYTASSHLATGAGETVGSEGLNSVALDDTSGQFPIYFDIDGVNPN